MRNHLTSLAAVLLLAASALAAKPAKFDIPAQPAADALLAFSKQSGADVLYSQKELSAVRSNPVTGEHEPDAAIAQLLNNTGFAVTRDAGKFVVTTVRKMKSADSAPRRSDNTTQGTATVAGRVQNLDTGRYLNNARVSIRGTVLMAFTDETGTYRLAGVPSGPMELEVFFTGLEPQQAAVNVAPGGTLVHDFQLARVAPVVKLEKFTVKGAKDFDAISTVEAISANEQRFSPNLKLVAAPTKSEFVMEGNVGEFMKSLPSVSAEYWEGEIIVLSVRGFDWGFTGVTIDGAPFASASTEQNFHRGFETMNVSMNNFSRVEITHVPTPSTPADSLGGSINLVTKSAFERNTPQLSYSLFVSANQHAMNLRRSADSSDRPDRETYKVLPGFTFDYTLPVNNSLGLMLSLGRTQFFKEKHTAWEKDYSTNGTATRASISNPYLKVAYAGDSPRSRTRDGGSLRVDWRVTPNSLLSFGVNGVAYDNRSTGSLWYPDTGSPLTFGPDFTHGATGRGVVKMTGLSSHRKNSSLGQNVRWRFDDGTWRVEGGAAGSRAKARILDLREGSFNGARLWIYPPGAPSRAVRVNLDGITASGPSTVQIFDNNNQPVDPSNIQNYRLDSVWSAPAKTEVTVKSADASVRRQIDALSFPAALQLGGSTSEHTHDARRWWDDYNFNGGTAPAALAPYLSLVANRSLGAGFPSVVNNLPWISTQKLYAASLKNPGLIAQTPSQVLNGQRYQIENSEWIREQVTAAYLQGDARLFQNRLGIVTGLRWERTQNVGLGPLIDRGAVFLRDARGAFVRDALGRQIRRPEAGAGGSLEELRLTSLERGARAAHTFDGFFPSVNATYHATENFQIRLGWAKTYGRPDFYQLAPNTIINQANLTEAQLLDRSASGGTLSVNNPALKPWSAENYDLSFEYYSEQGGLATLGVFQKNIRDFFGDVVKLATADDLAGLGLDSSYVGWNLSTQTNTDRACIRGVTLNLNQSLRALGPLGRHFVVFGNVTELQLDGNREADFTFLIKSSASWGFKFSGQNFDCTARWNYRGLKRLDANPAFGPDAYDYVAASTLLDVNLAYRVRPHVGFFVSANNLFNRPHVGLTYGSQTPFYARQRYTAEYGAKFAAGIKGTF